MAINTTTKYYFCFGIKSERKHFLPVTHASTMWLFHVCIEHIQFNSIQINLIDFWINISFFFCVCRLSTDAASDFFCADERAMPLRKKPFQLISKSRCGLWIVQIYVTHRSMIEFKLFYFIRAKTGESEFWIFSLFRLPVNGVFCV